MTPPVPPFAAACLRGLGHGARVVAGLALIELVLLVPKCKTASAGLERGLACLGHAALIGVPVALTFGVLFALARSSAPLCEVPAQQRSVLERLVGAGAEGSARILSLAITIALYGAGVFAIAYWAITSMQQTIFMALGTAVLTLLLLVVLALLHLSLHGAMRRAFVLARKLPPVVARALERPMWVLLGLVGVLAIGALVVTIVQREITQYLPWTNVGKLAFALSFAIAGAFVGWPRAVSSRPWFPRARQVLRALGLVVVVVATVTLIRLDPKRTDSAQWVEGETLSGAAGHALLLALFDRDHDGHLSFAGGGDCRPGDHEVHPGAIDHLGDGIDGDCDGEDARKVQIPRGEYQYRVPERVPKPQQIFLLTIDALQYHRVFAKHEGKPYMPNLEALAIKSVVFEAAFSQGAATRDAFPAMFTSRWGSQIKRVPGGKSPHGIDKQEVMLAETLRDKKYKTLAVLPNVYFFPKVWKGLTDGFQKRVELPGTSRFKGGIHNAEEVADAAIDALSDYHPNERLFAWVHFFDAHAPYTRVSAPGIGPFSDEPQGRYDSEIQYIDRHVGRVIEAIEKRGYSEPLIVVTADHGTSFDKRHVRPYGQDLYSDITRVPLLVWGRAFVPRRDQSLVSTMDLAPTLLNLVGTGMKLPYEGVSLVPQLVGDKPVARVLHHQLWAQERIVHKKGDPLQWASVRDDRFHLLHDRDHDRIELYDWRRDPFEKTDLLRNPKHADVEKRLRTTLSRLLAEIYPKKKKKKK